MRALLRRSSACSPSMSYFLGAIIGGGDTHHYRLAVGIRATRPGQRVRSAPVKFIYKPIGIFLGILAGLVGKRLFNFAWTKIDDEDPPKGTTEYAPWVKVLGAEDLGDGVVGEDAADAVREQVGHGEHRDVVRRAGLDRDRVRDHDLLE